MRILPAVQPSVSATLAAVVPCPLSARELDIMRAIVYTGNYVDAGELVGTSRSRVRNVCARILDRLGVDAMVTAVGMAYERGWISNVTISARERSALETFKIVELPMPEMMRVEIGKRIAARRKELGMTQRELGSRLLPAVCIDTVSRMERGLSGSGISRSRQLARILKTTESALLRGK